MADKEEAGLVYDKAKELKEKAYAASPVVQEKLPLEIQPVSEDEELYVDVGDAVTYCDIEKPEEKIRVQIVRGPDEINAGVINENRPLAQVLLGASEGEEIKLTLPGRHPRKFRILKIFHSLS